MTSTSFSGRHLGMLLALLIASSLWVNCGGAPNLDASHQGWLQPNCHVSACHLGLDHNRDLSPYQCTECHGNNGAPPRPHQQEPTCGSCHILTHGEPSDYPDPDSCHHCH